MTSLIGRLEAVESVALMPGAGAATGAGWRPRWSLARRMPVSKAEESA